MNHYNILYLCIACAEEMVKAVIAAEVHQFHLLMIYDQRKGKKMQMFVLIFPLHTLKPCCARQTPQAALKHKINAGCLEGIYLHFAPTQ